MEMLKTIKQLEREVEGLGLEEEEVFKKLDNRLENILRAIEEKRHLAFEKREVEFLMRKYEEKGLNNLELEKLLTLIANLENFGISVKVTISSKLMKRALEKN